MPVLDLTPPATLADVLLPRKVARTWLTEALLIVLCSGLVAASARLSIPLPFTPVPITGQTFAVLFTGAVLGSRRGALALLLYLLEGAAGLPVFAGGTGGALHLIGPTGGYLISYPLAAGLVGWLAERGWDRQVRRTVAAMLLGNLVIFTLGILQLSLFTHSLTLAFMKGMLPFLPGDLIKIGLAALLLPGGWALVRRLRNNPDEGSRH